MCAANIGWCSKHKKGKAAPLVATSENLPEPATPLLTHTPALPDPATLLAPQLPPLPPMPTPPAPEQPVVVVEAPPVAPTALKVPTAVRVQCGHCFTKGDRGGQRCTIMCAAEVGWCSKHKKAKTSPSAVVPAAAATSETVIVAQPTVIVAHEPAPAPADPEPVLQLTHTPTPAPPPVYTHQFPYIDGETEEWWEDQEVQLTFEETAELWGNKNRQEWITNWRTHPRWLLIVNPTSEAEREEVQRLPDHEAAERLAEFHKNNPDAGEHPTLVTPNFWVGEEEASDEVISQWMTVYFNERPHSRCEHVRKRKNTDTNDVDLRCTTMTTLKPCGEDGSYRALCGKHCPKVFRQSKAEPAAPATSTALVAGM